MLAPRALALIPGLAAALLVAAAAQFLSAHYGAPAMLMALLLGLAVHFLSEDGMATAPGIAFTARSVLRFGVVLLGARISVGQLAALGAPMIALIVTGVVSTILFALLASRAVGRGWRLALLTSGAVAICGASAAMAIAAVLPRHDRSERDLLFTVLSVTLLSTAAMIAYPMLVRALGLTPAAAGVFLGGTIHDVAQVVGAGFSVGPEVGETATLVKLIRVTLLAPLVLAIALAVRLRGLHAGAPGAGRTPLLPGFVLGFLALAALNSLGVIPPALADAAGTVSRWALLVAMAAVGMKTALRGMLGIGGGAVALIVAETLVLGGVILGGLHLLA